MDSMSNRSVAERTIYLHRDRNRTTEFRLILVPDGVEVGYLSVFDADTGETDTYSSRPFSRGSFQKALEDLTAEDECELKQQQHYLRIKREASGRYTFDCGDDHREFVVTDAPFDVRSVSLSIQMTGKHSCP